MGNISFMYLLPGTTTPWPTVGLIRVHTMELQIVAECLGFCIAQMSLLFLPKPRAQISSRNSLDHPIHPVVVLIRFSIQIIYRYKLRAGHTPARRPLCAGGHTRRGPPAAQGGSFNPKLTLNDPRYVGRQNTGEKC